FFAVAFLLFLLLARLLVFVVVLVAAGSFGGLLGGWRAARLAGRRRFLFLNGQRGLASGTADALAGEAVLNFQTFAAGAGDFHEAHLGWRRSSARGFG